jgi:hypothetical protein
VTLTRERLIRAALIGILISGMVGCSTKPILMRNPQTGEIMKCGPYYPGGGLGYRRERDCIQDFQRQGWERVPE